MITSSKYSTVIVLIVYAPAGIIPFSMPLTLTPLLKTRVLSLFEILITFLVASVVPSIDNFSNESFSCE